MWWMLIWGCTSPTPVTSSPVPTPATMVSTPVVVPAPVPVPTPVPTPPPSPTFVQGHVVFWGTATGDLPALHLADTNSTTAQVAFVHQVDQLLADPAGENLVFIGRLTDSEAESSLYTVPLQPNSTPTMLTAIPEGSLLDRFSDDGNRIVWLTPAARSFGITDLPTATTYTHPGPLRNCGSIGCQGPSLQPGTGDWWAAWIDGLFVGRSDGTDVRAVEDLEIPRYSWTSDGSRLIVAREGHLVSTLPDGTDSLQIELPSLYDTPADIRSVTAQPSGDQVAFSANARGSRELWSAPADGSSTATRLTPPHPEYASGQSYRWSPSGSTILYSSSMNQTPSYPNARDLFLTRPGVAAAENVGDTVNRYYSPFDLAWSPDERYALTTSVERDSSHYAFQLIDLQTAQTVWSGHRYSLRDELAKWAPDGSAVYIEGHLVQASTATSVDTPELAADFGHSPTAWLADSSALVGQLDTGGALVLLAPDGTSTTLIGPGFEPLPPLQWEVLDRPTLVATPFVPPVTDLSEATFEIPDPAPASHRYLTPAPGTTFTAISVGLTGYCALQSDGTPVCEAGADAPPQGTSLSSISAGGRWYAPGEAAICGLRQSDSVVVCWGDAPAGLPTDLVAQQVVAGGGSVCVLHLDDSLQCWGENPLSEPGPFTDVRLGTLQLAARRTDGTLWWQGHDTTVFGSAFQDFSAGEGLCALDDGSITCQSPFASGPSSSQVYDVEADTLSYRFADLAWTTGGAIESLPPFDSGEERVLADTPPTGLRFSDTEAAGDWICGLVEDGSLVFCHESYHEPIYPP